MIKYTLAFLLLAGTAYAQPVNSFGINVSIPNANTTTFGLVRPDNTTITITNGVISAIAGGTVGVSSFNTRTGSVTLLSADVTAALGFTPSVAYTLPTASTTVLGGVKVDGTTVTITGGVISAVGGGGSSTVPVTTVAASGAAQTLAAATSGSKAYDITLTANCTITLSGGTVGQQQTITAYLRQDATAGRVVTLPTGVRWPGGVAPTPGTASGGIDVFIFTTPDAGTTWFGSY